MVDQLSITRLQTMHPKLRAKAIEDFTAAASKLTGRAFVRVTEAIRTWETSNKYYAQGRTKPGKIITNAPGGYSYHNFGLAFDIALVVDKTTTSWSTTADYDGDLKADWMEFTNVMIAKGWTWGGGFKSIKDMPHFEYTFGYSTKALRELHNAKKFITGTTYVQI